MIYTGSSNQIAIVSIGPRDARHHSRQSLQMNFSLLQHIIPLIKKLAPNPGHNPEQDSLEIPLSITTLTI